MKPIAAILALIDPFNILGLMLEREATKDPEWVPPPMPRPARFEELRNRLELYLHEKSGQDVLVACGFDFGPGEYKKIHIVGPGRPVPFSPGAYLDVRISVEQRDWKGPIPEEFFGLPCRFRFNQDWFGDDQ